MLISGKHTIEESIPRVKGQWRCVKSCSDLHPYCFYKRAGLGEKHIPFNVVTNVISQLNYKNYRIFNIQYLVTTKL
jgi:hypothetical protein